MGRYITTKADFTLRRKHKKGSGTTIYENDYTTINPMPNALKGEYVIGDSNFVFTSRLGINGQKKHVRGKFAQNPMGENSAWTMDTLIDSGITNETKVRLKPNYTNIKDFACYGSAVKLVQGTINGVITEFPAEMYLSNNGLDYLKLYAPDEGKTGYSFNDENELLLEERILYNEYGIDITTVNVRPESIVNPLRFFTLCGSSYTYIEDGNSYDFVGFTVKNTSSGTCYDGKNVEIDQLALVTLLFSENKTVKVKVFKDNTDGSTYYTYEGKPGSSIRPKNQIVEDYFRNCDDFTAVLLDRVTKPIYTAVFETPRETDTGYFYDFKSYTWPTLHGGFNPDLTGAYYTYVELLMNLAEYYDEFFSDNAWRSLTHEAIKTLDWTYLSSTDGEFEDMSTIDTSRVEPIAKIYGRQFDDLKRYADGIKSVNTVTYDQKSNVPDYNLTDILENSGWEVKTLKITGDKDTQTSSLYSGLATGYTASDANNEFIRRMKLNSRYLLSTKGTRKGIDAMLAMFGFNPEEYDVHEYVEVFNGSTYPHFCDSTMGNDRVGYPLAKDVSTVNKFKINFNSFDTYGDYCGIPVAEIGYFVKNPSDPENPYDCSYVVPWFSKGKKYDDGLYFQMHGGWKKKHKMDVSVDIAPNITEITDMDGQVPLYGETQARLKFANDFDDLLQEAYVGSNLHDVFYVTDISKIMTEYTSGPGEDVSDASHYFVLENSDLNQFLGYSESLSMYGWRSIGMNEITGQTTAGTLVLYLESIKDDTTGNNPHVGNGTYDDGSAYIESMRNIFGYSLGNRNFIGIDSTTCEQISQYVFVPEEQEDNRKCWYFTDDYNVKYGKEATAETIEFMEADLTDMRCRCDYLPNSGRCTEVTDYEISELLTGSTASSTNNILDIGTEADKYMIDNAGEIYTRGTSLNPYDPEMKTKSTTGESAANSIVNVKKLVINFNLQHFLDAYSSSEQGTLNEYKKDIVEYVETNVMPYLSQMIPATSILECTYSFGEEVNVPVTASFEQTDN